MTLQYISDHIESVNNLINQYKGDEFLEGFLIAWLEQIQLLEDVLYEEFSLNLDNAYGLTLDGFGSILDEARKGREDEPYRLAIKLKRAILFSDSTPENILLIMTELDSRGYEYKEYYNASFILRLVDKLLIMPLDTYSNTLRRISPAGVRWLIHYSLFDDADTVRTAVGDIPEAAPVGKGSTYDDYNGSLFESGSYHSQIYDNQIVEAPLPMFDYYVTIDGIPYVDMLDSYYVTAS